MRAIVSIPFSLTLAALLAGEPAAAAEDRFDIGGQAYVHAGGGVFAPAEGGGAVIDLHALRNGHDPAVDPDAPLFTDVTLPGVVPELIDAGGRPHALITLYNIDPPLEDLPSREPGVDRGLDLRDPASMLKSAYSNYVSPVATADAEARPVPGHPIGHFYVKVEIPGYPAILTGMTTLARADAELVDLTLGRRLGLGGVLLTVEPGRLNRSAEAMEELGLRQRRLRVVDGRNFRLQDGVNVGPVYLIEDGNVTFARFRVPVANARDALEVFLGFVAGGQNDRFGSLLSRPALGDGAGCSAFAMSWLQGAGVIPFVDEAAIPPEVGGPDWMPPADAPFWAQVYDRIRLPWEHVGCDDRAGLGGPPEEADYTVYDLLFHGETAETLVSASEGFAEMVASESGALLGSAFRYGARTPLRGLVVAMKRKDPYDLGDYAWAPGGEGLEVGFWNNARFGDFVKARWAEDPAALAARGMRRATEGRFRGVEIDAMATPRRTGDFFALARESEAPGPAPLTCRALFAPAGPGSD